MRIRRQVVCFAKHAVHNYDILQWNYDANFHYICHRFKHIPTVGLWHEKQWCVTIVYLQTMKNVHVETVNVLVTSVLTGGSTAASGSGLLKKYT